MTVPALSVILIVKNGAGCVERCLASVRFAGEIIVVDSGSQDDTVARCRRFTDKIFERAFTDYADQKNFALSKASGEWVLSIDADEEAEPFLKEEVLGIIAKSTPCAAYRIRRRSFIFGREFRCTGTQDDCPVRLFRRRVGRFKGLVHEKVQVDGSVDRLRRQISHYTYDSLRDYMQRFNRYTSLEAQVISSRKIVLSHAALGAKSLAMFLRLFLLKRGFMDGMAGFIFAALSGYYVFVKHAKAQELLSAGS